MCIHLTETFTFVFIPEFRKQRLSQIERWPRLGSISRAAKGESVLRPSFIVGRECMCSAFKARAHFASRPQGSISFIELELGIGSHVSTLTFRPVAAAAHGRKRKYHHNDDDDKHVSAVHSVFNDHAKWLGWRSSARTIVIFSTVM